MVLGLLGLFGCGGPTKTSPATTDTRSTPQSADVVASDPRIQYFHEQLIISGEDLQSDFGGDLTTLGLNPRDLQQDDAKHAYDTVLERVRAVEDASVRREMMRVFFNDANLR